MSRQIDTLLNPRSVAVIGASKEPGKRGYRALRILLDDGYSGKIFPINPKERDVLGLRCYPDIAAVGEPVDVALVCTPAPLLPEIVEQCGAHGVIGAVVVSGGFSEAGEEGLQLEQRSVQIARRHGLRIVGPNMNGIYSRRHSCNLSPWREVPRGDIAVVSNSANIVHWLLTKAWARGRVGFSTLLSVGNQADVQFHELIEGLGEDAGTRAIIVYAEGFKDGRALVDAARRVAPRTPIVMYKAGRNAEGARMAKSHSGSLAGDYAVSSGALRQAGVTLVSRAEHLLPVAEALAQLPPPRSRSVAVISEGGGPITIAAEMLVERGLALAPLTAATRDKIRAAIPRSTTIANPVDIAVLTDPSVRNYGLCARAILEDPGIDALLFVGWFGAYGRRGGDAVATEEKRIAEDLARLMREHGKPVVVQSHYAHIGTEALDALRAAGVPVHQDFDPAVECLRAAAEHAGAARRLRAAPGAAAARPAAAERLLGACRAAGREALLEHEARDLLEACGVPVPPRRLVREEAQLPAAVAALGGGPLALKVVSPDILHKSEAGGVRLGVSGEAQALAAMRGIVADVRARLPRARIEGVLASPMAPRGVEVIVGMSRDAQFGPVVVFGLGGIFVEVLRDAVFRVPPLAREDALQMMDELRAGAALDGARGLPPADREALADLLLAVSRLALACPEIAEIDLNPVIAHERGYSIVDARVILGA